MNKYVFRLLPLVAPATFAALVAPGDARAEIGDDSGVYIGLSYGESEFFRDTPLCEEFSDEVGDALEGDLGQSYLVSQSFAELVYSTECRQDTTDSASKYFLGYRFNRAVAVELSKIDFGRARIDLTTDLASSSQTFSGDAEVTAKLEGLSLSGIFSVPIGDRFGLFARLGVLNWDVKGRGRASGTMPGTGGASPIDAQFVASESGADVHYGVGGRLRITDNVAVRAEWERFEVVEVDVLSAGLEFSF